MNVILIVLLVLVLLGLCFGFWACAIKFCWWLLSLVFTMPTLTWAQAFVVAIVLTIISGMFYRSRDN